MHTTVRPGPRRWRMPVAAVVLVVAALVCGCGSDPAAPDPLPHGERRPAPITFSAKPLWDERKLGMADVSGAVLHGDIAVVAGTMAGDAPVSRLAVVDARSGVLRWSVDTGGRLKGGDGAVASTSGLGVAAPLRGASGNPVVIGDGDDWTVVVQYTDDSDPDGSEFGLAALSGKDGTVRWKHALVSGSRDGAGGVTLLGADPRVVLASVERVGDLRTVALDLARGRELWRYDGAWAYRISGDLVLGETRGDGTQPWLTPKVREQAAVIAVDLRTGAKRWEFPDTFEGSRLEAAAGGIAVVSVQEKAKGATGRRFRTMQVDTATGRVRRDSLAPVPDGPPPPGPGYDCDDDGRALIACHGAWNTLVTIRSGAHDEPVVAKNRPFGSDDGPGRVDLVWRDRVFVSAGPVVDDRPVTRVLDRAANRLGGVVAGRAVAMSECHGAFLVPRDAARNGLAVRVAGTAHSPSATCGARE